MAASRVRATPRMDCVKLRLAAPWLHVRVSAEDLGHRGRFLVACMHAH
jgi:hypothetical protein